MKNNRIIIILLIAILLTGCSFNKEENNTASDKKAEIRDYIKKTTEDDLTEWTYADDKLNINDDLSVEVIAHNVRDEYECTDFAQTFINLNLSTSPSPLNDNHFTFICKKESDIISKVEVDNISRINNDNFYDESNTYDKDNKEVYVSDFLVNAYYIKDVQTVPYKTFFRKYDDYINTKIHLVGEVFQVVNVNDKYYQVLMNVTKDDYGYYDDAVSVIFEKRRLDGRPQEDDIIDLYGLFLDVYSYQTVMGDTREIPSIYAKYLKFK